MLERVMARKRLRWAALHFVFQATHCGPPTPLPRADRRSRGTAAVFSARQNPLPTFSRCLQTSTPAASPDLERTPPGAERTTLRCAAPLDTLYPRGMTTAPRTIAMAVHHSAVIRRCSRLARHLLRQPVAEHRSKFPSRDRPALPRGRCKPLR
jgi:hypothetical protein